MQASLGCKRSTRRCAGMFRPGTCGSRDHVPCRHSRIARNASGNGKQQQKLMSEEQYICLSVCNLREHFRADYEALQARLHTLPERITHDIMVCLWELGITIAGYVQGGQFLLTDRL